MSFQMSAETKNPLSPMIIPVQVGEAKNPYSPMSIPLGGPCLNKDHHFDFELIAADDLLEPESEQTPRGEIGTSASRAGVIPSFASTVSDNDFPQYAGGPGSMIARGPRETASWGSNATDFDDLTCPGAQAEQSNAYRQAVFGGSYAAAMPPIPNMQPFGFWNGAFAGTQMGGPQMMKSADALQNQAEELDRAAEQLMAAAMQAQAAASQMKSQRQLSVPAAASQPQRQKWNLFGSRSKKTCADRTTVMLRNLPNDYTREMLLELLDAHGFRGHFDFVYLPIDFKRKAGLGYAFVNMSSSAAAEQAFTVLQGFTGWQFASSKMLEVAWGEPLQGLDAHIDRYRNSPVMHADVPEKYRPMLFQNGVQVPFPQPTKKVQKPRMKACRPDEE